MRTFDSLDHFTKRSSLDNHLGPARVQKHLSSYFYTVVPHFRWALLVKEA